MWSWLTALWAYLTDQSTAAGWTFLTLVQIVAVTLVLLLACAFLIWGDRKLFAGVQMRKGPNVVGPFGLLQSFADLGKFLLKEMTIPAGADKLVFLLAPLISVTLAFGASTDRERLLEFVAEHRAEHERRRVPAMT